jgi:hypothetical protein
MSHLSTASRLRVLPAASLLFVLLAGVAPAWSATTEPFTELLEASLNDRKGVVLYVKGQAIAGRVTKMSAEAVELTSREYTRIIVRRESIDAVAGN